MRRHVALMLIGAVALGCVAMAKADEAPKTKEDVDRAVNAKANRERKEEVDKKIRLLEALEGSAKPAPKAERPAKVDDSSVRIVPSGPRETVTVEWVRTFEQSGDIESSLKTQNYGQGRVRSSATSVEPDKVEFSTEQENWRIGWMTESMERTGRLKMKLLRKVTLPSGLTKWVAHTSLPSLRAGQSGGSYSTGKGEFMLELTGLDVKYKVFVEEPKYEKVTEERGPKKEMAGEKKAGEGEKKAEETEKAGEKKAEDKKVEEKKADAGS